MQEPYPCSFLRGPGAGVCRIFSILCVIAHISLETIMIILPERMETGRMLHAGRGFPYEFSIPDPWHRICSEPSVVVEKKC